MKNLLMYTFFALVIRLKHTVAFPSGLDLRANRTRRDISCRDYQEYLNGNICCLNCPAGMYVKSPCTRAGEKGQCEECEYGTFTEHSNELKQCLKCTQCRSDQETVRACTGNQNAECRCKSGRFCDPDQACEVCKKCSRCENDEVIVRNCTSTTNTECKKISHKPASTSGSQQNLPDRTKTGQASTSPMVRADLEVERERLCETPSDSANSSQHNLTCLPSPTSRVTPVASGLPNKRDIEQFPTLMPVNGEQSLKDCFKYFEELDVCLQNKFFRHLGINDNAIKSTESLSYDDRMHELLKVWMEKEGRRASLNDLLRALLELNQRRTAETIKQNAVEEGHYRSVSDDDL
ncbi:hematopoietic death receptor isoform X2 [Parambassis ranga]|uniref:Hematopoietic death receptor isoform X2 n=1 Tax=Parambassis ranga TaxID=210632 RepID=A0A6P7J025_9TELE|nr:tumor necrosis factor receptor superfamily member 6-like isoform X2 [Parambassis ranga]